MVFAGLLALYGRQSCQKIKQIIPQQKIDQKREHMLPLGRTDLLDPAPGFYVVCVYTEHIPCTGAYGNKRRRYLFDNTFFAITLLMAVDLLLPLDLYSVSGL